MSTVHPDIERVLLRSAEDFDGEALRLERRGRLADEENEHGSC